MVEKELSGDDDSTVVVDAIADGPPAGTLGAAIEALEARLASKGISIQLSLRKPSKEQVDGRLLLLPAFIKIGITHGIETTKGATHQSVGKLSMASTLVPGNVIALTKKNNCRWEYLHIRDDNIEFRKSALMPNAAPDTLGSEYFVIVDAGNENFAFYCPSQRRFLGCKDGRFSATGYPLTNTKESPRANETFRVVLCRRKGCYIQFRCPIESQDVPDRFQIVQVYGFN